MYAPAPTGGVDVSRISSMDTDVQCSICGSQLEQHRMQDFVQHACSLVFKVVKRTLAMQHVYSIASASIYRSH